MGDSKPLPVDILAIAEAVRLLSETIEREVSLVCCGENRSPPTVIDRGDKLRDLLKSRYTYKDGQWYSDEIERMPRRVRDALYELWTEALANPFYTRFASLRYRNDYLQLLDAWRLPLDEARADNKPDTQQKSALAIPENRDVLKLAKRVKDKRNKGRTLIDVALDFTECDEKKSSVTSPPTPAFPASSGVIPGRFSQADTTFDRFASLP